MREFDEDFRGVFSSRYFRKGSVVHPLSLENVSSEPTRTSVEVGPDRHAEDSTGRFINHACSPSCVIRDNYVVAVRNIYSGDEITFDYAENETRMASPFLCDCCGKIIKGKSV